MSYKDKDYHKKYYNKNKKKLNEYRLKHYHQHPEWTRNYQLKSKYGLSIEGYDKLFQKQNGCCAICNRPQSNFKKALGVDHNHKTKHIRGLLCAFCNGRLLRYLHDDKQKTIGLVKYFSVALEQDSEWK